jgi:hypothetical protein
MQTVLNVPYIPASKSFNNVDWFRSYKILSEEVAMCNELKEQHDNFLPWFI